MRRAFAADPRFRFLLALLLAAGAGLLLLDGTAWARVGGGQGYSGGGGSSGGGGYGGGSGGGGDGLGALIELLVWLCIHHPAIGIPITILVVAIFVYAKWHNTKLGSAYKSHHAGAEGQGPGWQAPQGGRSGRPGRGERGVSLKRLVADDPNFSEPLFVDFAQLVYARVQRARGDGDLAPVGPLVGDGVRQQLQAGRQGLTDVRDVIFGATHLLRMHRGERRTRLTVRFETNLTEVRGGKEQQLLRIEDWTFTRDTGVLSPGPERMRSLGCPSCGSTLEPGPDGRCPNCDTVRTGGHSQWMVETAQVVQSRPLSAPELHLGGGVEPGTRLPTRTDPDLPVQWRALQTRHPDFSWQDFEQTVTAVFHKLQEAWSEQAWEKARPYETDALFQQHAFWMERYRKHGLVNRLTDVHVRRVDKVKVGVDAYYEHITVRVFASMKDWTEDTRSGRVVGGSQGQVRVFSEYWTFIRRIGGKADPNGGGWSADHCPSCGAPLDKVNQAGVCGYCEAKISTGDFDWVLSRIEQDETYKG